MRADVEFLRGDFLEPFFFGFVFFPADLDLDLEAEVADDWEDWLLLCFFGFFFFLSLDRLWPWLEPLEADLDLDLLTLLTTSACSCLLFLGHTLST